MFKVVVEQKAFSEGLRKIRNSVGKGKEASNINEKFVYMELLQFKRGKALRLLTYCSSDVSDVFVDVISGVAGISPLVEYAKLVSMISTIDGTIEITLEDTQKNSVSINYAGRKKPIEMNAANSDTFIKPPEVKGANEISVPFDMFSNGIDAAATIIHEDKGVPLFNCVNIKINTTGMEFQAIDSLGKKMVLYKATCVPTGNAEFFVDCNTAKRLISNLDSTKGLVILTTSNNIIFQQPGVRLTTRLTVGTFPDCNKFMPDQYSKEVLFNRDEMLQSLKRAKLIVEDSVTSKSCIFDICGNFICLNVNSTIGNLYETVLCQLKGPDLKIAFVVDSVIKILESIDSADIKMCFYNENCAIIMPDSNSTGIVKRYLIPSVRQNVGK